MRSVALVAAIFAGALGLSFTSQPSALAADKPDSSKSKVVTIKSGDSLSKIADKHKTTYQRIFNKNTNIKNPDIIYPGDKVSIPNKDEQLKQRELPSAPAVATPAPAPAVEPVYAPAEPVYQPAPAPAAPVQQPTPAHATTSASGDVWDRLAQCESGGNWSIDTGNGYHGGLQFSQSSWEAAGGSGSPSNASRGEQIARAETLQQMQGWGAWPSCSAQLDLL